MTGIVYDQRDPAYPEPTGPHCEVCWVWTPNGDLCAACDANVHADLGAAS